MGGVNWNYKGFWLSVNWGPELTGDIGINLPIDPINEDEDNGFRELHNFASEAWARADWDSMSREEADRFMDEEKKAMEKQLCKFCDLIIRNMIANGLLG